MIVSGYMSCFCYQLDDRCFLCIALKDARSLNMNRNSRCATAVGAWVRPVAMWGRRNWQWIHAFIYSATEVMPLLSCGEKLPSSKNASDVMRSAAGKGLFHDGLWIISIFIP